MKILFFGDIFGRSGRDALIKELPYFKKKYNPDFVLANGENASHGKGISKSGEILDLGVELELIQKSGSWFSYKGEKLGQGRDSVKTIIEDNPELTTELEGLIKEKLAS